MGHKHSVPSRRTINFTRLPEDVLMEIALEAPPETLVNLCQTNRVYARICENPFFWKEKLFRDYPHARQYIDLSNHPEDYRNVYIRLYRGLPIAICIAISELYPYYIIAGRQLYYVSIDGTLISPENPATATLYRIVKQKELSGDLGCIYIITPKNFGKMKSKPVFIVCGDMWAILETNIEPGPGARAELHEELKQSQLTGPVLAYHTMWVPSFNVPFYPQAQYVNPNLSEPDPLFLGELRRLQSTGEPVEEFLNRILA